MRTAFIYPMLGIALLAYSQVGIAANASVKITSPADGATLDAMAQNVVVYDVVPGASGDHVHLYVDSKEAAILRQLKGSYTFETLPLGKHDICIKIVNKGHTPIGVEQCIKVTVN